MQTGKLCAVGLRADSRADTLHLVCSHAHADARAAEQNAGIRFTGLNLLADFLRNDRIVARGFIGPAVDIGDLLILQIVLHNMPQRCSSVVTSDRDHNRNPPSFMHVPGQAFRDMTHRNDPNRLRVSRHM